MSCTADTNPWSFCHPPLSSAVLWLAPCKTDRNQCFLELGFERTSNSSSAMLAHTRHTHSSQILTPNYLFRSLFPTELTRIHFKPIPSCILQLLASGLTLGTGGAVGGTFFLLSCFSLLIRLALFFASLQWGFIYYSSCTEASSVFFSHSLQMKNSHKPRVQGFFFLH